MEMSVDKLEIMFVPNFSFVGQEEAPPAIQLAKKQLAEGKTNSTSKTTNDRCNK